MDASGSTGNDVSKVKDVDLHKVRGSAALNALQHYHMPSLHGSAAAITVAVV